MSALGWERETADLYDKYVKLCIEYGGRPEKNEIGERLDTYILPSDTPEEIKQQARKLYREYNNADSHASYEDYDWRDYVDPIEYED